MTELINKELIVGVLEDYDQVEINNVIDKLKITKASGLADFKNKSRCRFIEKNIFTRERKVILDGRATKN